MVMCTWKKLLIDLMCKQYLLYVIHDHGPMTMYARVENIKKSRTQYKYVLTLTLIITDTHYFILYVFQKIQEKNVYLQKYK